MLEAVARELGGAELLQLLGGGEVDLRDPEDPATISAIAQRLHRLFTPRVFALLDWLVFAPDDELQDMLADDSDEEP